MSRKHIEVRELPGNDGSWFVDDVLGPGVKYRLIEEGLAKGEQAAQEDALEQELGKVEGVKAEYETEVEQLFDFMLDQALKDTIDDAEAAIHVFSIYNRQDVANEVVSKLKTEAEIRREASTIELGLRNKDKKSNTIDEIHEMAKTSFELSQELANEADAIDRLLEGITASKERAKQPITTPDDLTIDLQDLEERDVLKRPETLGSDLRKALLVDPDKE